MLASIGTAGLIAIGIGILVVMAIVAMYNGLVGSRLRVKNAYSQIDVQLKRRYDLIPNLVETVKGYAAHEKETLERVIAARNQGMAATTVPQQAAAENQLSGALRQLFALSEAYPDLKANQNFAALQEELTGTENKISFARQYYNNTVENYNAKLQTFPTVVLAGMFGFRPEDFFEVSDSSQREAVKVKF
jgi:LemA protein